MAQHDYVIANNTGAAVRSDLNNALAAIVSQNSAASEPATMYAYQWWADTTTGLLKIRNAANNAWVTVGTLASANLGLLSSGGTVTAALGSASTPGITFTGDLNTGIYSPGADQVAISTNGSGRLFVDASGNVGINTSPSSLGASVTTLEIKGGSTTRSGGLRVSSSDSSAKGAFYIYDGVGVLGTESATPLDLYTGNSPRIRITSAGLVGIGITAPQKDLQINAITPTIRLEDNGGNSKRLELSVNSSAEAKVFAEQSGSQLLFGTTGTERARITSDGKLLVGTSSDSGGALLQVNGDRIRVGTAKTPASATDTGTAGEICWDANYIYVCTATNTWKRTAIATW